MTYLKWLKEQGKALVIKGPEGCGKSLMARQLAGVSCPEIGTDQLNNASFQDWLDENNGVVIVEGLPRPGDVPAVESLITSTKMTCNRRGREARTVDTPMFIFCTCEPVPFAPSVENRRFHVIEMRA